MNKSIIAGVTVVALIVGGVVGYLGAGSQYSAQLDKAKKAFPTLPATQTIFGTIKSISGNVITLQTQSAVNPFENIPEVRTVTVTSATKIVKNERKDLNVLQQEMADYQKALKSTSRTVPVAGSTTPAIANMTIPPMPFTQTEIKLSDLKVGDMVSVDADKDIKTEASFEVVKIVIEGTPVIGPPPPLPSAAPKK